MISALLHKRTRSMPVPSSSSEDVSSPAPPHDWDKTLTDGMIYLLAIGGFYVGYQTLYNLALAVDFPHDQAVVVASLVDLAILAYSRKAVQEVNEGRSAWGIRLIVAALSLATFALQIRAAWPHPTAVTLHALPPAVWVIGHEMMLRGKLRNAKRQRRDFDIAQGLRPARLPSIRATHWILSPIRTFQAWRLTKLWEVSQRVVIKQLAEEWQASPDKKDKPLPAAWRYALAPASAPATATLDRTTAPKAIQPPAALAPAAPPKIVIPAPSSVFKATPPAAPPTLFSPASRATLYRASNPRTPVPADVKMNFLAALPVAPAGGRPKPKAREYITEVQAIADQFDINATGRLLATLLQVDETYVSRLRKELREMSPEEQKRELAAVGG
ncbi:DUF2637 domain-containing protein [Streptomyces sp. NPDC018055]|uniref:DUF2637 domain-containing protein n=1 Tax=Streptomyces sp. NPDC018055 TaxID=3365038 RepID=UPI0037BD1D48